VTNLPLLDTAGLELDAVGTMNLSAARYTQILHICCYLEPKRVAYSSFVNCKRAKIRLQDRDLLAEVKSTLRKRPAARLVVYLLTNV
jgi:hypothetical protein